MNNWTVLMVVLAVMAGGIGWAVYAGWWAKLTQFLREVNGEMAKVSFPSRDEVVGTTIVVLVTSFVFAFYLWIADLVIVQLFKVVGS